jgi:flavorubredoxin
MAEAQVTEIVDGIYRICSLRAGPAAPVSFNQFLINDERPALIHTGYYDSYDTVRAAVAEVLDPKRLAYVVLGHFESDECGGMDRFVADAPNSVLVASELGATVNLAHWNYKGPVKGMRDGDVLDLGHHRLRFLETPHVHHWDSMMLFDETTSSLFPADLFIQPGDQPPVVTEDLTLQMLSLYRKIGIFAHEAPVRQVVSRVQKIDPAWIHPMHGGSFRRDIAPRFYQALRAQPFAYEGMLRGRELPIEARAAYDQDKLRDWLQRA